MELEHKGDDSRPSALQIENNSFDDEERLSANIDDVLAASPRISENTKLNDNNDENKPSQKSGSSPNRHFRSNAETDISIIPKRCDNAISLGHSNSSKYLHPDFKPRLSHTKSILSAMSAFSGSTGRGTRSGPRQFSDFSPFECYKYTFFVLMFTIMAALGRTIGSYNYLISHQVQRALIDQYFVSSAPFAFNAGEKTLKDVDQYFEIYDWMTSILIPVLLPEVDANNQLLDGEANPGTMHLVSGQNRILGAIQIRQLRVKEEECLEPSEHWVCYPPWDERNEATQDMPSGVTWKSKEELGEHVAWWGKRNSYSGSGYAVDLPLNQTAALLEVQRLKTTKFIDRATRWIVNDFVVYNYELNLHCIGRISFELPASGGVIPTYEVKTWNFYRYESTRGRVCLAIEILVLCFIVYFTFEEIWEFKTEGWTEYKNDHWNSLDIINLIFFYINIAMRIREVVRTKGIELLPPDNTFLNLRDLAKGTEYEAYLLTVNGFLMWIKMFKYLTFSKRIRFLFEMLARSSNDLLIFGIVLCVVNLAFATVGFIAFSSDVEDFRSLHHSFMNLLRYFITELPYDDLRNSNRKFGSIYFCAFQWVIMLIMANVFIAILCDAYADVIAEVDAAGEKEEFSKLFAGAIGLKDRFGKIMKKIKSFAHLDKDKDGKLSAKELAQGLGVTQTAANSMIDHFDTDDDGQLDKEEYAEWVKSKKEEFEKANKKDVQENQVVPISEENASAADAADLASEENAVIERMERMDSMVADLVEQQNSELDGNGPFIDDRVRQASQNLDHFVNRVSRNDFLQEEEVPVVRGRNEQNQREDIARNDGDEESVHSDADYDFVKRDI